MTEQYEKISSMVDDECENLTSAQIKEIVHDEEQFKVWQRYNLMKSLLKNEVTGSVSSSFMDGFASKFEKEPIVMAPKAKQHSAVELNNESDVIQIKPVRKPSRWIKFIGQGAIAASVLVASVVGVNVVTTGASESTDNVIGTTPFGGYASPVSAHFETNRQGAELDSLDFIDMNEVMNHQVSPYNGGELDPIAENELSKVESLLSDHDYQVSIYSVRK